jgi:hypothetical protein
VCDQLNEKDIKLLETMILNFNSDRYQKTRKLAVDLFFDFMYSMTKLNQKKNLLKAQLDTCKKV